MPDREKKLVESAERVRHWLASDKGKEALKRTLAGSRDTIMKLRAAREIDPSRPEKPITL